MFKLTHRVMFYNTGNILIMKRMKEGMYMTTKEEKETFIEKLSKMSDDDIQNYIKQYGKSNANDKLFVFQWDRLDPRKKQINNK